MCTEQTDQNSLPKCAKKIRATLKRLEQIEDVLDEARAEFEHELRRAGDALVRAGGRSWRVESQIKELRDNIALNKKDLEENKKQRQQLEICLKRIERELC